MALPFTFTGPANVVEQVAIDLGSVHCGYALHNYGAVAIAGNHCSTLPGAPTYFGGQAWNAFRSAGVASASALAGSASAFGVNGLAVPLAPGAAAGNFVLIGVAYVDNDGQVPLPNAPAMVVTTPVAGNVLVRGGTINSDLSRVRRQFGGNSQGGFDPPTLESWFGLYKCINPVPPGTVFNVSVPTKPTIWFSVHMHVLSNLFFANPVGDDPGVVRGFEEDFGPTFPICSPPLPTPKSAGLFLLQAVYFTPSGGGGGGGVFVDYSVNLARGVATVAPGNTLEPGSRLSQEALPELVLTPGCQVVMDSRTLTGQLRNFDQQREAKISFLRLDEYTPLEPSE